MKKAKAQVGYAARSIAAIGADGNAMDETVNQLVSASKEIASACKNLPQARKKQKTHIGQAGDHVANVSTTLEDGMA